MQIYTRTATIASGQSLSGAVDLFAARTREEYDPTLAAIQMPAAWTSAKITFQVSNDGETYGNLYKKDGSTEHEVDVSGYTAASSGVVRTVQLEPQLFFGFRYMKIRSGTAASPVSQAAERSLSLFVRDL